MSLPAWRDKRCICAGEKHGPSCRYAKEVEQLELFDPKPQTEKKVVQLLLVEEEN